jgi:hypothetical protein
MAGVVAGATGAALTAIVMIFEMTLDYSVVLPMTLTVAVSYGLRRYLCPESIYTMKLARRGHYMPQALQANAHLVHHVSDMTLDPAVIMPADTPVDQLDLTEDPGPPFCVVLVEANRVTGVLPRDWVLAHPSKLRAAGVGPTRDRLGRSRTTVRQVPTSRGGTPVPTVASSIAARRTRRARSRATGVAGVPDPGAYARTREVRP